MFGFIATVEYRGHAIEYDHNLAMHTVNFCGDAVVFSSVEQAKAFIDELENL